MLPHSGHFFMKAILKRFRVYFGSVYKLYGFINLSVLSVGKNRRIPYSTRTPLTMPSWLGRFVILTLPLSVWTIVPLLRIFCLARNLFAGVSRTFFISSFWTLFPARTFTILALSKNVFLCPPIILCIFFFCLPSATWRLCPG